MAKEIEVCKNCGREIMEGVTRGKSYWYHCIDFGDCNAEPMYNNSDSTQHTI